MKQDSIPVGRLLTSTFVSTPRGGMFYPQLPRWVYPTLDPI